MACTFRLPRNGFGIDDLSELFGVVVDSGVFAFILRQSKLDVALGFPENSTGREEKSSFYFFLPVPLTYNSNGCVDIL